MQKETLLEGENSGEQITDEEVLTLRKTVSELREMVRYMKSEREMNDSRLDSARRTINRERGAAKITRRSLDEARAELELLQSNSGESKNNDSFSNVANRLEQAEEQLVLLRESNELLREESDNIRAELQRSKIEADQSKSSFESTDGNAAILKFPMKL